MIPKKLNSVTRSMSVSLIFKDGMLKRFCDIWNTMNLNVDTFMDNIFKLSLDLICFKKNVALGSGFIFEERVGPIFIKKIIEIVCYHIFIRYKLTFKFKMIREFLFILKFTQSFINYSPGIFHIKFIISNN